MIAQFIPEKERKRAKGGNILTKRTDGSNHSQSLTVRSRLHVFGDFQHLALHVFGPRTRRLSHLQATEDIPLRVCQRFALLQRDRGRKTVPVLPNQAHIPEHDLLAGNSRGALPCGECALGAGHRFGQLIAGHLRNASDEVVGGRIVDINCFASARQTEFIVDEIRGVLGVGYALVGSGEHRRCRSQSILWGQRLGHCFFEIIFFLIVRSGKTEDEGRP